MSKAIFKKTKRKYKDFNSFKNHVRFYDGREDVFLIDLKLSTKVRTYLNLIFRLNQLYKKPIVIEFSLFRLFVLVKWFKIIPNLYLRKPFQKLSVYKSFSHSSKSDFQISFNYKKVYDSVSYVDNVIPYIMHPVNYYVPEPEILEKKVGILFSGNVKEEIYNSDFINNKFLMLNRWQIFSEIQNYSGVVKINNVEFFKFFESGAYLDKFVLLSYRQGAIPIGDWRKYLSSCKYLFCAPGMTMPLCHNVLEAMSVGVVPILNYPNWLNPSLKDKFNSLIYNDFESMKIAVEYALNLSDREYKIMQENVLSYFNSYYHAFSFPMDSKKELILLNENIHDLN